MDKFIDESNKIILSIAIPTKDRSDYVKVLINDLTRSSNESFEIVVHDNSSHSGLGQTIAALKDDRIRYHHEPRWLSVVDNCDAAVRACRGTYVCMIGDDDGILLSEALDALATYKRDGIEAVTSPVLHYVWPDLEHPLITGYAGRLAKKPIKGNSAISDFNRHVGSVFRHAGAFGLQGLPCVYHGFIAKIALDRLYSLSGSYFPGPSPDMANAVGLTSVLSKISWHSKPLVITGHSAVSTAGAGTRKSHHGSIAAQPHLPKDTAQTWDKDIPFFWSGPTIYAQSLRSAARRCGRRGQDARNLACLYATCLIYHREYLQDIRTAIRHSELQGFWLWVQIIFFGSKLTLMRAKSLLNNLMRSKRGRGSGSVGAKTISDAMRIAKEWSRS